MARRWDVNTPSLEVRNWGMPMAPYLLNATAPLYDLQVDRFISNAVNNASDWFRAAVQKGEHWNASRCHRLRGSNGTLHVVVLGTSVTTGCGALGQHSARCVYGGSWGHQFASRLGDRLRTSGHGNAAQRIEVDIWGRNAVGMSYFGHCPSRFGIRATTDVVLLELEPPMGFESSPDISTAATEVSGLVRSLRRLAPDALYCFVGWAALGLNGNGVDAPGALAKVSDREAAMAALLQAQSIESVFATPALDATATATLGNGSWHSWFNDRVHPNPSGHALLAEMTVDLVHHRLHKERGCDRHRAQHGIHRSSSVAAVSAENTEICYMDSRSIPVANRTGFELRIDERAKALKGVIKEGYTSDRAGSTLTIGPIAPDVQCGLFEASLGYLQSWRREMGAFHVGCEGCTCKDVPGAWAAGAFPFPLVRTHVTDGTTSLTAFTKFILFKEAPACFIRVTHLASKDLQKAKMLSKGISPPPTQEGAKTVIRLDAFGMQLATCMTHCQLTVRPHTRAFGSSARSRCWEGARDGQPGYLSPACFNASPVCSAARHHPGWSTGF